MKNGVKSVPEKIDDVRDFKIVSRKNDKKLSENADKITIFERPSFKNGVIFGKIISAYEKIKEIAQR